MSAARKPSPFRRRYLIFPKAQIKYASIFATLVGVLILASYIVQIRLLQQLQQIGLSAESLQEVQDEVSLYYGLLFLISVTLTFMIGIVVTHRFLGPVIAIQRGLENFRETGEHSEIVVRKHDEIKNLVDSINVFLQEMDRR